MQALTVYCSSSTHLDPEFHEPAAIVGAELARRGISLVYGGGKIGLMGEVAQAIQKGGGRIVGVITQYLLDREQGKEDCDELIIVDSMRERKRLMAEKGDGFLILPGGLGTYEEFFEILTGRVVREHTKPIGIVNVNGYFNPFLDLVAHGIEHRFIKPAVRELFIIDPDPRKVVDQVCSHQGVVIDDDRFLPMGSG